MIAALRRRPVVTAIVKGSREVNYDLVEIKHRMTPKVQEYTRVVYKLVKPQGN